MISVDQVVTARGIVVSRSPTLLVQPLETSIVNSIDVSEGERVHAGQILATSRPDLHRRGRWARLTAQVSSLTPRSRDCRPRRAASHSSIAGNEPDWLLQLVDIWAPTGRIPAQVGKLQAQDRRTQRRPSRRPNPTSRATQSARKSRRTLKGSARSSRRANWEADSTRSRRRTREPKCSARSERARRTAERQARQGSAAVRERQLRAELVGRRFAKAVGRAAQAQRREPAAEQGQSAPLAGRVARRSGRHRSVARESVGRLGASVGTAVHHAWCPPGAALEVESQYSWQRERASPMSAIRSRSSSTRSRSRNMAWPKARCGRSARTASRRRKRRAIRPARRRSARPTSRSIARVSRSTTSACMERRPDFRVIAGHARHR